MRKLIKLSVTLLCLCSVFTSLMAIPTFADAKVIANYDFEDCRIDEVPEGWTASQNSKKEGAWVGVVEDPDNPENQVLAISGNGTGVLATLKFEPVGGDVRVKYKVRLSDLYDDCHYVGMMDGVLRVITYQNAWNLWDGSNNQIVVPDTEVKYNEWYDMEYVIRFSDHTYDILCNGEYFAQNYEFWDPNLESIDKMWWSNLKDIVYIDDVVITNDGDIKTVYTKVEASAYKVDSKNQTIKNIDAETTVDKFMSNMKFVDGAVVKILNADGTPYTGKNIVEGLVLDVSSPDGDQKKVFQLHPSSAAKEIVSYDFEDCKIDEVPDGWTVSHNSKDDGTWGGVTQDPDNPENQVMAVAGNGTGVTAILNFEPAGGDVRVKYKVRLSDLYNDCHYVGMMEGVLQVITYQYAWNLWNGSENQVVVPNTSIKPNEWYDMEYVLRFSDHTYDLLCNGEYYAENYSFMDPDKESIGNMYWGNPKDIVYIDDIVIESGGEVKTVYTKVDSSAYNVHSTKATIKNIGFETTVDEFMSNMILVDGAVIKILDADGNPYTGRYIVKGLVLDVSSPEGDQQKTFEIHPRTWNASLITVDYCKDAIVFGKDSNDAMVKGNKNYINPNDLEVKTFEEDGKMYLPLRFIAEQKGHKVSWIASEGAVEFGDIKLLQSNSLVTKNSQTLNVEGKCINKNGTIYVPYEWIGEMLDVQVLTYENVIIVKDDVSFAENRMEKLALREIAARFN